MNRIMKKGLILMMVISAVLLLAGCQLAGKSGKGIFAKKNEGPMKSFSYHYDGTIGGNSYSYKIEAKDDGSETISYESMMYPDMGEISMETGGDLLANIYELYVKHKAYRWDGYSKYAKYVMDGSGFSVYMSFADGNSESIHGSNCAPDGFRDFETEVERIVNPYIDRLIEMGNRQQIEKGVSGKLQSLLITFKQQGSSGSDSFEGVIRHYREGRKNFDIRINSVSGEFIEPGKYNYYSELFDEDIYFDEIQALIEKYEIIKWYNWDKSAEDYSNEEWFQISFGFEDGTINAMGTLHPENYDRFRKELLELIVKIIKDAEAKYPAFRSRDI